jgi:hypothetical protein
MKSWKLRCCIARKRVGAAGERADTGGLTAVRSLFKIFFLHQLDALTFDKSPCRDLLAVVNAHPSPSPAKMPCGGGLQSAPPSFSQCSCLCRGPPRRAAPVYVKCSKWGNPSGRRENREKNYPLPQIARQTRKLKTYNSEWRASYSFGGSGAPPTCKWLKSCSVARSSSLMPLVKFGSFSRWLRADSGMFCSTRSRC